MRTANLFFRPVVCLFLILCAVAPAASANIMLAGIYEEGVDVAEYLVSEKLDGVRARWDGKNLISRGGNKFAAPYWWTEKFPPEPIDGELWMGRGRFEETLSVVRKSQPHPGWVGVKFLAFDLPEHGGTFEERDKALRRVVSRARSDYLKKVRQFEVESHEHAAYLLEQTVRAGGEGLMLHKKSGRYKSGRSSDLLKFKKFYDDEAVVVSLNEGEGKYKGMLGSLTVRTPEGIVFKIGTGFTDEQRKNPPPAGSVITYKYAGLTNNGVPKFASFWRVREGVTEESWGETGKKVKEKKKKKGGKTKRPSFMLP